MMYKKMQYNLTDVDLNPDDDITQAHIKDINSEINALRKFSDAVHFFDVDICKGDVLEIRNDLVIMDDDEKPLLEVTAYMGGGQVELKKYFAPDCTIEVELTATDDLFIRHVVEHKEKEPDIDKIALKICELISKAQDTYNPV